MGASIMRATKVTNKTNLQIQVSNPLHSMDVLGVWNERPDGNNVSEANHLSVPLVRLLMEGPCIMGVAVPPDLTRIKPLILRLTLIRSVARRV
jgi:hypothetical protein